ncbi:MAG: hypothetical protein ACXV5H_09635 [Halobacteriota archaeon]
MSVSEIQCADDLAALASEAVQQVRIHKQYRDLIGAVLMANHIADWHYVKDLNRNAFDKSAREAMKACYPEWDILRELANGTKHCKAQAKRDSLQWKHADFWSSPGHVGEDWLDWFVDFEGQPRSVTVLIETFLEKFADRSSRPK